MTAEKALELLEMSGSPDADAVRRSYAEAVSEPKRLADEAASTSLRDVYERRAAELAEARDLLLGGAVGVRPAPRSSLSATQSRDLPSREPSSAHDGLPGRGVGDGLAVHDTMRNYPKARLTAAGAYVGEDPAARLGIEPGQVLADRYEVRGLIGAGGMGEVYAAFDRVRGEEVAVKVLLPHLLADPKAHDRFLNEAKIASDLAHPGIVRVYDLHETSGMTFLTMELLRGRSLRDEIIERKESARRFGIDEVRNIADQLCAALAHAHTITVHRDIKPENVWLREDGAIKLMDFGIARLLRPSQFTSTGMAMGTAYYMAPEQLRGQEDVTHLADQFAVGVMLYELLTGEVPQGAILAPREVRKSIPAAMSTAVMKALAGDPLKRYPDIASFRQALSSVVKVGVRTKLMVAAVAAAAIGAILLIPGLRGVDMAEAVGPQGVTVDTRAAEAEYPALSDRVEALRKEAEGIGTKVDAAKTSGGETGEWMAEIWHRHPQQHSWFKQGKQALDAARKHSEKKEIVDAVVSLKEAEVDYAAPVKWLDNATKSLASAAQSRDAVRELVLTLPADASRTLSELPETLLRRIESKLLQDEGEDGPAEAADVAKQVAQYRDLLKGRRDLVRLVQEGKAGLKVEGLAERYQVAETRLQEADRALAAGHLRDAERLYGSATDDYRQVADGTGSYLQKCLDDAGKAEGSGDYTAAVASYQKFLEVHTGNPEVTERQRRATVAGRVAKVGDLDREGARDEAVSILADLRRQYRDDSVVRDTIAGYIGKLKSLGAEKLAAKRYDEAKETFQLVRKLGPNEDVVAALLDDVERQRLENDKQVREAEKEQIAREQQEQRDRDARLASHRAQEERVRREVEQEETDRRRAAQARRDAADAEVRQAAELEERKNRHTPPRRQTDTFGAVGVPAQGGGMFITESHAGTPAARLGLEYGDVILSISGYQVNTEAEYFAAVRNSTDLMRFTFRNVRSGAVTSAEVWLDR